MLIPMFAALSAGFMCLRECALVNYLVRKRFFKCFASCSSFQKKSKLDNQIFTVAVEGNIGSGKTSVLQYFTKQPNVMVLQEPVSCWQNMDGLNLLNLMYQDPSKYSFLFQSYVQLTMLHLHLKGHTHGKNVKLMERSIFSAKYCFAENLFRSQMMSEPEYIVLSNWFEFLITNNNDLHLNLIVYLQASPETCYKNIQNRCRKEEMSIKMEYLRNLHSLHEDWLIEQKFPIPCPVLVIPADCSKTALQKLCRKHAYNITFGGSTCSATASI